uniref:Reverse transcriptase RNase H-like domain-containing protein n=1 Tax=Latimeria chalumnae TaxID=7897 RepID=H3A7C6_LATCH
VLNCLKRARLTLQAKKSQLCCTQLKYMGHVVTAQDVKPDPEKVTAIENYPEPKTVKLLQYFLGMAGWYYHYMPHFSENFSVPLSELKKGKGKAWQWATVHQESFQELKEKLMSSPILGYPNFNATFIIQTDASNKELETVLWQNGNEGEDVITYSSHSLTSQETHYNTTEQECLAAVWAVKQWRHYVEGHHFEVITDHAALTLLFNFTKPTSTLVRRALWLQEFKFDVKYHKGTFKPCAKCL